jgi:hypothetical protein
MRWKRIIALAILKTTLFVSGYWLGVRTAEDARKTYHSVFESQKPENGFNQDMYDIEIERKENGNGKSEVYLVNTKTNEKKMIGPGLATGTIDERLDSIKEEIENELGNERYSTKVLDLAKQVMKLEYANHKQNGYH